MAALRKHTLRLMVLVFPVLIQHSAMHRCLDSNDAEKTMNKTRNRFLLPDIPHYHTLKCDFHMHTYLSDGIVSPAYRVKEAWKQDLDAIAITDHIEFQPMNFSRDRNEAYRRAKIWADSLGLILINGCEVTRRMPPGHFNLLFLKDANLVNQESFFDVMKAASEQAAFVFYNHPHRKDSSENRAWTGVHDELVRRGWLHGIEIANQHTNFPHAHDWCREKNLTLLGNSDLHISSRVEFPKSSGEHRPMTLVFAFARTLEGIREALFAHRTLVVHQHTVSGDVRLLESFFHASVTVKKTALSFNGIDRTALEVRNNSSIPYLLIGEPSAEILLPANVILPALSTTRIPLSILRTDTAWTKACRIAFRVDNAKWSSDSCLHTAWNVNMDFLPLLADPLPEHQRIAFQEMDQSSAQVLAADVSRIHSLPLP